MLIFNNLENNDTGREVFCVFGFCLAITKCSIFLIDYRVSISFQWTTSMQGLAYCFDSFPFTVLVTLA
ncbi:hypothetical protein VNO80_08425 [Phaseolus coccineus]|uniref:Uncharacterized protein n=1 Tax=Phaseolus coccineus TaxID=3886 RepID=A0AAN9NLI4_PHACN